MEKLTIIQGDDVFTKKKKLNKSAIAGIVYLLCCVLFTVVKILSANGLLNFQSVLLNELVTSSIIQIIILFTVPVVLYTMLSKQNFKQTFKDFSFKKIKPISILYAVLIGIGVSIIVSFISNFFATIISFLGAESITQQQVDLNNYSVGMFFVTVLTSCLLPGICEEVAHRGMLVGAYKKFGTTFAIVISAVMFGLLHMNIYQCFYAFFVGLFFAFVCIYTRSIIPGMIMHFMNNFLNTVWDFSYVNNWLGGGLYSWENSIMQALGSSVFYFLSIVIFIGAVMLVTYLTYKLIHKERLDEILSDITEEDREEYEFLKQNRAFMFLKSRRFVPQTIKDYKFEKLKQQAHDKKVSVLEFLENDGIKLQHKWYDNIFIYTAIVLGVFYTIYSFMLLVV